MRFNSVCKDDKGRNTSIDMGNSLLAFQQGVSLSFKDEVFLKQWKLVWMTYFMTFKNYLKWSQSMKIYILLWADADLGGS